MEMMEMGEEPPQKRREFIMCVNKKSLSAIPPNQIGRKSPCLGIIPQGTLITAIDLDLTVSCNLRCVYCFKEKWNEHMPDQIAFDALIWLLHASGPVKDVHVNFMGGEPLVRFQLIKKIVPFGRRRAWQMGKNMTFGATVNGTLVTDEVVDFWRQWGMGFHTSIDGVPEIQNRNRPTASGGNSSEYIEKAIPKILAYAPYTTARSTVVPDGVGMLVKNFHYFRFLGYWKIAFVAGEISKWNNKTLSVLEEQCEQLGDLFIEELRKGNLLELKGLEEGVSGIVKKERAKYSCGAGRGMALIDIHGNIWPCHRWNKTSEGNWKIGNIYESFDSSVRAQLDSSNQTEKVKNDCSNCNAQYFCFGGCPAENLEEMGDVFWKHPNGCRIARIWAKVSQRVHDVLYVERNQVFMNHFYREDKQKRQETLIEAKKNKGGKK